MTSDIQQCTYFRRLFIEHDDPIQPEFHYLYDFIGETKAEVFK